MEIKGAETHPIMRTPVNMKAVMIGKGEQCAILTDIYSKFAQPNDDQLDENVIPCRQTSLYLSEREKKLKSGDWVLKGRYM